MSLQLVRTASCYVSYHRQYLIHQTAQIRLLHATSTLCYCKTRQSHSPTQYVMNKVKTWDYESYLLLLLGAKKWRYPMFVIHAYNVELSLALESASEAIASSGRFAFWSDAIAGIYNGQIPYDQPVIQELHKLYSLNLINSQQSKNCLLNMLTSRQQISRVTHLETLDQLETYSEHTKSSLLYLALNMAGHSSVDADHAASHIGRCCGLMTALRSTPYLASRNQLLLPQDILSKHKVSQSDVLRAKENVKEPVFEIASQASIHLEKAKPLLQKLPKDVRKFFLLSAICEHHLELLRRCDFNVFDPLFLKKNPMLPWYLWKARRKL